MVHLELCPAWKKQSRLMGYGAAGLWIAEEIVSLQVQGYLHPPIISTQSGCLLPQHSSTSGRPTCRLAISGPSTLCWPLGVPHPVRSKVVLLEPKAFSTLLHITFYWNT